jgi:hypothetical protein
VTAAGTPDPRETHIAMYLTIKDALPAGGDERGLLGKLMQARWDTGRDYLAIEILQVVSEGPADRASLLDDVQAMRVGVLELGQPLGVLPGFGELL